MAKTTLKYFNGTTELHRPQPMDNKEFVQLFPGVKGKRWDGFSMMVANPLDFTPVFDRTVGRWTTDLRPVTRVINYKSNPSKHICDARCMNATGRTMQCECSCGGKNHGNGGFRCE
jgi:hypothetical protein